MCGGWYRWSLSSSGDWSCLSLIWTPTKPREAPCVRKLMESHPSVVRSHRIITVDEIQDERKHHTNREAGNMIRRSTPRFISKKKKSSSWNLTEPTCPSTGFVRCEYWISKQHRDAVIQLRVQKWLNFLWILVSLELKVTAETPENRENGKCQQGTWSNNTHCQR